MGTTSEAQASPESKGKRRTGVRGLTGICPRESEWHPSSAWKLRNLVMKSLDTSVSNPPSSPPPKKKKKKALFTGRLRPLRSADDTETMLIKAKIKKGKQCSGHGVGEGAKS